MTKSENELWPLIINMCLAVFLANDPAKQIRKIAKQHIRRHPNTLCKNALRKIVKSRDPVSVVIMVHEDIINDSQNKCEILSQTACLPSQDDE